MFFRLISKLVDRKIASNNEEIMGKVNVKIEEATSNIDRYINSNTDKINVRITEEVKSIHKCIDIEIGALRKMVVSDGKDLLKVVSRLENFKAKLSTLLKES